MDEFEKLGHYSCWMILTNDTLINLVGNLIMVIGWSWRCQFNQMYLNVANKLKLDYYVVMRTKLAFLQNNHQAFLCYTMHVHVGLLIISPV